jgi:hypothetical protein
MEDPNEPDRPTLVRELRRISREKLREFFAPPVADKLAFEIARESLLSISRWLGVSPLPTTVKGMRARGRPPGSKTRDTIPLDEPSTGPANELPDTYAEPEFGSPEALASIEHKDMDGFIANGLCGAPLECPVCAIAMAIAEKEAQRT